MAACGGDGQRACGTLRVAWEPAGLGELWQDAHLLTVDLKREAWRKLAQDGLDEALPTPTVGGSAGQVADVRDTLADQEDATDRPTSAGLHRRSLSSPTLYQSSPGSSC